MQIFNQKNLERNLLNHAENFQNSYQILRDNRAGLFNYALRLFALILTTLLINTMGAEPLLSKENYYPNYSKENYYPNYSKENYDPKYSKGNYDPKYSYESSRTTVYEVEEPKHDDQKVEYSYKSHDNYLLSYLYYLWHWFWCNIVLILIIAIILWFLFRWYYRYRISQEFAVAETRLPVAGDLTVGNARFMLGTLRNSLPL